MFVKKQKIVFYISLLSSFLFPLNEYVPSVIASTSINTGNSITVVEEVDVSSTSSIFKKSVDLIIDLRSEEEFNQEHIKNAINVPIETFKKRLNEFTGFKEKTVFIYCNTTNKSRIVAGMMSKDGFKKIKVIQGGYQEWKKKGLELIGAK